MSFGIGVAIHSIEKLPILEQVLKPALLSYIDSIFPLPSHLLHFQGLPRVSRGSAIQVFLVIFQSWELTEIVFFLILKKPCFLHRT